MRIGVRQEIQGEARARTVDWARARPARTSSSGRRARGCIAHVRRGGARMRSTSGAREGGWREGGGVSRRKRTRRTSVCAECVRGREGGRSRSEGWPRKARSCALLSQESGSLETGARPSDRAERPITARWQIDAVRSVQAQPMHDVGCILTAPLAVFPSLPHLPISSLLPLSPLQLLCSMSCLPVSPSPALGYHQAARTMWARFQTLGPPEVGTEQLRRMIRW